MGGGAARPAAVALIAAGAFVLVWSAVETTYNFDKTIARQDPAERLGVPGIDADWVDDAIGADAVVAFMPVS